MDNKSFKKGADGYARCEQVLATLNKHRFAPQFSKLSSIPGFANAVTNPINLSTLGQKVRARAYTTTGEFIADGRRIWQDVIRLSQPNSALYNASIEMSKCFEGLISDMGNVQLGGEAAGEAKGGRKGAVKAGAGKVAQRKTTAERPMSNSEKAFLKTNIMRLPHEKLQGIIEIIQSSVDTSKSTDTLEFDIDKLPVGVARALDNYVKENLPELRKASKKASSKKRDVQLPHKSRSRQG